MPKSFTLTNLTAVVGAGVDSDDLMYIVVDGVSRKITVSELSSVVGGGLSNVVEDTTPQLGGNLDVNGNSITSASNGNIIISPNGTGAIQLDSSGNTRGTQSIDLQSSRSNVNQVASGARAAIIGGQNNLVSATHSAIVGGQTNVVESAGYSFIGGGISNNCAGFGYNAIVGGSSNNSWEFYTFVGGGEGCTASGRRSAILGGEGCTASETGSVCIGGYNISATGNRSVGAGFDNTVSGDYAFVIGDNNLVSGNSSIAAGSTNTVSHDNSIGLGINAVSKNDNSLVIGAPYENSYGDCQFENFIKKINTTNTATSFVLPIESYSAVLLKFNVVMYNKRDDGYTITFDSAVFIKYAFVSTDEDGVISIENTAAEYDPSTLATKLTLSSSSNNNLTVDIDSYEGSSDDNTNWIINIEAVYGSVQP